MRTRQRRILGIALASALAAGGIAVMATPAAAAATVYYISPAGADAQSGSASAPFRTIQKCATVAVAGDVCEIATGTYRETVTPAASGSAAQPIVFRAAPGATVTVDGTDAVTGWQVDSGSIYRATMTLSGTAAKPYGDSIDPSNADLWANQIFTGASVIPEAAYPATTSGDIWAKSYVNKGSSPWSSAVTTGGGACVTAPCTSTGTGNLTYNGFPALGDMTGAIVQFAGHWTSVTSKVTSGDLNGTNKTLQVGFRISDPPSHLNGASPNFRLVGKKAFLTQPNQWFYDAAAQQLYVRAADNQVPQNITAKKRNYGFELSGRSHITLQNIDLFATSLRTSSTSSNISVTGMEARYVSEWQTTQFHDDLPYAGLYAGNHRADSGIVLRGTNHAITSSRIQYSGGAGISLSGTGHVIRDNLITDVGYNGSYTAAVTVQPGVEATIMNNTIRNTGRDAINMNDNSAQPVGYDLRIAYNDISQYAKAAYDLGAVYVCCEVELRGRIDHNTIHDPVNDGNGLHFDNGTYGVTVDHNVISNIRGSHGPLNGSAIAHGGWKTPALPYLKGKYINNTLVAGGLSTILNYYAPFGGANPAYVANTTTRNNVLDGYAPSGQLYSFIGGGNPDDANDLATTNSLDGAAPSPLYDGNHALLPGAPAIDQGVSYTGFTEGYSGAAPDQGAYESGQSRWLTGCSFTAECGDASMGQIALVNRKSGKVVAAPSSGAQTVQQTDSANTLQQWSAIPQGDGYVQIKNLSSGQCLAVTGSSIAEQAAVLQWGCSTQSHFLWNIREAPGGYQQLVAKHSAKCLTVQNASTADGANLVQASCQTATEQQFTVQPVTNKVDERIDNTSGQITYAGAWSHANGESWSLGSFDKTESYSATTGATATVTFTGTGIALIAPINSNEGIASISIDGGPATTVDLYDPTKVFRKTVFEKKGLASGSHTITVTVTGTKRAVATAAYVEIDAFIVRK